MLKPLNNNWIGKPWHEMVGILSISFICCLILYLLPNRLICQDIFPDGLWLFLIVFVDVGHVYSTVYRTYAERENVLRHKKLFIGLPLLLLVLSVLLHSLSGLLFWRCLAYLAVYHFIRQQYGFMKIYSRKEDLSDLKRRLDACTIYALTLLPVLYWHVSPGRHFNWFIDQDFLIIHTSPAVPILLVAAFWLTLVVYLIFEIVWSRRTGTWNWQKNLIVSGTALSWYMGIIHYNSDLAFTFLNVICHGVPYMTLVWIHGRKQVSHKTTFLKIVYGRFTMLVFLLPLFFMAYVEEGFWDVLIWKEHSAIFGGFDIVLPKQALNILVPLLSLPQLFHYVIDGFIWRMRKDRFNWTKVL